MTNWSCSSQATSDMALKMPRSANPGQVPSRCAGRRELISQHRAIKLVPAIADLDLRIRQGEHAAGRKGIGRERCPPCQISRRAQHAQPAGRARDVELELAG